jgi:hypothetical protein
VTAPALLYWGDADTFGGADLARATAGLLPDSRLRIVPGAGHLPWLDDPAHCAAAVTAFLDGSDRAEGRGGTGGAARTGEGAGAAVPAGAVPV